MMIPIKESAFRTRVEASLGHQPCLVDLWNAEGRARAHASAFFAREYIATIDTLPWLEALMASDVNPYPEDADVHFTRAGYDAITRTVVERLERDGIGRMQKAILSADTVPRLTTASSTKACLSKKRRSPTCERLPPFMEVLVWKYLNERASAPSKTFTTSSLSSAAKISVPAVSTNLAHVAILGCLARTRILASS
jgi:hypothetical protein